MCEFITFLAFGYFPLSYKAIWNFEYQNLKTKTKTEISFLLTSQLTAPRVAAQVFTTVVWRPERVCHVHDQLGRLWAALSMVRQACPAWYGRRSVIQVSHTEGCQAYDIATLCTWTVSHSPACCRASEPYLPQRLCLHCPVNIRGTDWDRLTPSEDAVGRQTKADARLPLNSKSDAQVFHAEGNVPSCQRFSGRCCSWALDVGAWWDPRNI